MAKEAIPGNIKQADQFLQYVKKFIVFIRSMIAIKEVKLLSPQSFLDEISKVAHIAANSLKYCLSFIFFFFIL